jgi:hypothetical protein
MTMDLLNALEFFLDRNLRVSVSMGEKELLEIRTRDRNIDLEIKDAEATKDLLQELRRWRG